MTINPIENLKKQRNLPNKFTIALGELIKLARLDARLSQSELAENAFFSQAAISQIEKGKRSVNAEEIVYLSTALNKPITYFYSFLPNIDIKTEELSGIEQELVVISRKLSNDDLRKIIAQIRAITNLE